LANGAVLKRGFKQWKDVKHRAVAGGFFPAVIGEGVGRVVSSAGKRLNANALLMQTAMQSMTSIKHFLIPNPPCFTV